MATYPDIPAKGVATPITETTFTETDGNTLRGQRSIAANLYDVTIVHELVTEAEVVTIIGFFASNHNTVITSRTFDDGETYTGLLLEEPEIEVVNSTYRKVVQRFKGTRV